MENQTNISHYYCLILAGGKGRRLWPVSREGHPKQFLDFFGTGKSLLQQTYERFAQFLPKENIFVSTYTEYIDKVREQLPDLDDSRLLSEPIRRNTAPILAWATHRIENIDPDAAIIVSPSDQIITNDIAFCNDVISCMQHVSLDGCFLTMGIRPSRPEPGYGYIQIGEESSIGISSEDCNQGFYNVQSFTEKPERSFAEMFMKSGEFLWNTGLYVATSRTIHKRLETVLPSVMRSFDKENSFSCFDENRWVEEHYATYPNLSIESGLLEGCDDVCVKECSFGWADIGSWHGIYEALSSSSEDNILLNTDSIITDSTGCVISLPNGHKAVINGLHNFIVAEQDDVLLITPRSDSSSQVVKLQNKYYNE